VDTEWWYFDYDERDVRSYVKHHKNDRHGRGGALEFVFPRGPLVKLFLAHIYKGWHVITRHLGDRMIRMFTTRTGNAFISVTFVQFWKNMMETTDTKGVAYFAPSGARTAFVEDFTSKNGVEPAMWDGAAHIMGNTTRQWGASYRPTRVGREAQRTVDAYAAYTNGRMEDDAEEEREERTVISVI
jgi:hypothetical protein